jgi:hypothetical protein
MEDKRGRFLFHLAALSEHNGFTRLLLLWLLPDGVLKLHQVVCWFVFLPRCVCADATRFFSIRRGALPYRRVLLLLAMLPSWWYG